MKRIIVVSIILCELTQFYRYANVMESAYSWLLLESWN